VQGRIDSDADLKVAADELLQEILDKAEDNIFGAVAKGDVNQSQFVLKTLGKDRGYATRQESTGKDGGPVTLGDININFVAPKPTQEAPHAE
jgi:hypothetical protein